MSQVTLSSTPRVILVDIEGTTTSISFVKDVLFTYAAERLERYLNEHWSTEQLQQDVDLLRNEAIADQANGVNEIPLILVADQNSDDIKRSVVQNVRWQMSIDRKSRSLKQLQGHIWERGYADKDLLTQYVSKIKID